MSGAKIAFGFTSSNLECYYIHQSQYLTQFYIYPVNGTIQLQW